MEVRHLSSNTFKDQENMVKDFKRYARNRVGKKIHENISVKKRVEHAMEEQEHI